MNRRGFLGTTLMAAGGLAAPALAQTGDTVEFRNEALRWTVRDTSLRN